MTKRRRERDRPKAAHDALYNPNKRVLLSYASDEEQPQEGEDGEGQVTDGPVGDDKNLFDYEIPPYPDADENGDDVYEPQLDARDAHAPDQEDKLRLKESSEKPKRRDRDRDKGVLSGSAGVKKNLATNQWPVLGSLSYQWEDGDEDVEEDDNDSTTEEAMAYLRTVRAERQSMPSVLTSTLKGADLEESDDHELEEDMYYDDGVFIARSTTAKDVSDLDASPQAVFTKALVTRFLEQRRQMHQATSAEMISALDTDHPISFPKGNNKAVAEWLRILPTKAPLPAQLRSFDQATVYNLLDLIQTRLLLKGRDINHVASTWIWSLLARLQEVGDMTNDEVYPLRELGKRAIFVHLSFTNPAMAVQLESLEQGETTEAKQNSSDEISLDADLNALESGDGQTEPDAPKPMLSTQPVPTTNTSATLDMIVVIVGEVFGQRDLLEFRQVWTPPTAES